MIAIIAAMQEEMDYLLRVMTEKQQRIIANCHFYEGKLKDRQVVLLRSGIGKVNAAMATTLLLEHYEPKYVINTGSAGGYSDELEIGDVVLSTDVVHHDVDATNFNYAFGQVPGMPERYIADPFLLNTTSQVLKDLNISFAKGTIASGDSFMSKQSEVDFVRQQFPTLIAFEMEAAAVAQVCYIYQTPFVVIRALSDIAGKQSTVSFERFLKTAAKNSSEIVMNVIDQI